jgi:hypothetical protein
MAAPEVTKINVAVGGRTLILTVRHRSAPADNPTLAQTADLHPPFRDEVAAATAKLPVSATDFTKTGSRRSVGWSIRYL